MDNKLGFTKLSFMVSLLSLLAVILAIQFLRLGVHLIPALVIGYLVGAANFILMNVLIRKLLTDSSAKTKVFLAFLLVIKLSVLMGVIYAAIFVWKFNILAVLGGFMIVLFSNLLQNLGSSSNKALS